MCPELANRERSHSQEAGLLKDMRFAWQCFSNIAALMFNIQTSDYSLKPSANLRLQKLHMGGKSWLCTMEAMENFLHSTTSLIHPELHQQGKEMHLALRELEG